MSEITQIVLTLKRQLKKQGMTYRDVAKAIQLSEPSIKRMFATETFTLDRIIQLSNLLGFTLAELSREAATDQWHPDTLTAAQEQEIVSDSRLLLVTVCVLNHLTLPDISSLYQLTEPEIVKHLLKLDALRIIDLLPGNRIRLNISRDFHWLPDGPIRQYFDKTGLQEFLRSDFQHENEAFIFVHGLFSERAMEQVMSELQRLRLKFAELHESSLAVPMKKRHGSGLMLAFRKWEPDSFAQLKR